MNRDELIERLPEIEARVEEWLDTEREEEYHQGLCDEAFSLIHVFIPALCAAVREMKAENERLRKQAARYRAALEKIRDAEGRVCQEFETCEHAACDSSYGAWEIANVALRGALHEDGEEAENDRGA